MSSLRRATRLAALLAWSMALFLPALATRLLALAGARRLATRAAARVQRRWARGMLACMGARLSTPGDPPAGVYLIAANHVSWVDILALSAFFRARFVAKAEISGWPLLGLLARSAGTLFLRRSLRRDLVRVSAAVRATLADGVHVVVFPEGGASRGARVLPFHGALFDPVAGAETGAGCLPVAISYATPGEPWGSAWTVAWWGGMDFPRHAWRLLGLRRIQVSLAWPPELVRGVGRRELARNAHAALEERFRPLGQSPVPPDLPWPELARAASD
jgi:1-acyl-sn-glycerol-3-phosphate acyltransferase